MSPNNGKTFWIIGCSTGIGYALAEHLSMQGAHLILSARSKDKLDALNERLGGRHLVAAFDIGDARATQEAFTAIQGQCEKIHSALFLAASYSPHNGQRKAINEIYDMLRINLGGAFNMIDVIEPYFEKQGFGQIVLCGSVAGYRGLPFGQPYCATKAAIINLAESLKTELRPKNIDVKVINPGFVKTPLTDKNSFPMPMIITADKAAEAIAKGINRKAFEIHFPKRFTYLIKLLRIMPNWLYLTLARAIKS
jgi:short-subunit dehydrogenase